MHETALTPKCWTSGAGTMIPSDLWFITAMLIGLLALTVLAYVLTG